MKPKLMLARFASAFVLLALLSAACAPIPLYPPRALTPATSVFLPGMQAPGPGALPLQPPSAVTGAVPMSPTPAPVPAVVTPTSIPLPTLTGPVWQWVSSTFTDGTVLAPSDPTRYTFQSLGDGNGLVQADCNFGSATYEESGGNLSFSAIGTTKMACPPDSLDSAFLAQLRNSASYAIDAGELVITLKDQAGAMRLRAAPGEASAESGSAPEPPASPTNVSLATPTPVLLGTPAPAPTAVLRVRSYVARGNELSLLDVAGSELLVFVRG